MQKSQGHPELKICMENMENETVNQNCDSVLIQTHDLPLTQRVQLLCLNTLYCYEIRMKPCKIKNYKCLYISGRNITLFHFQ